MGRLCRHFRGETVARRPRQFRRAVGRGARRGRIEGGSLRLYGSQSGQWSLNYANLRNGLLTSPVYGGFDDRGRGLFYGPDNLDGRAILVRFIITKFRPDEARFEQAYSADGGVTWEDNWVATDSRK